MIRKVGRFAWNRIKVRTLGSYIHRNIWIINFDSYSDCRRCTILIINYLGGI